MSDRHEAFAVTMITMVASSGRKFPQDQKVSTASRQTDARFLPSAIASAEAMLHFLLPTPPAQALVHNDGSQRRQYPAWCRYAATAVQASVP